MVAVPWRCSWRLGHQLFIGIDAGLGLGLARLGRLFDPFAFARDGALLRGFLARFLLQALFLNLQERGIIAFVRNALAAIQFQDPAGDIVQEIAVMGDQDDAAFVFAQRRFQPFHRLRVQMVGGFVQQQNVGRVQQQLAQRDAAAFAARQGFHLGVAIGAAQRVHRLVHLGVQIPQALGLDLVLQFRHLVGGLVGIVRRDLVVAVHQRLLLGDAFHDIAAHVLVGIELRFLGEIAHAHAVGGPGVAGEFLVHPRHDLHQGGLARAVDADDADLGAGIEAQPDVLEHLLAAGIGLGQTLHHINELRPGHRASCAAWLGWRVLSEARRPHPPVSSLSGQAF